MNKLKPILCILFLFSASSIVAAQPPTVSSILDRVHPGDVIDVDVVGGFEFDWRGTLSPEGNLILSGFSETIPALCRTENEIAVDVKRVYGTLLRDPDITVKIVDRSKRPVARVDGAVRTPARFRILRPVRLRELLIRAGGLTDAASGEIVVFRPAGMGCKLAEPVTSHEGGMADAAKDNGPEMLNIKISELISGNSSADPYILTGDVVTVTRSAPFYVIGAVNNPRPIYSHTEMTLSRAIASAGGPSKDADLSKVSIFRREGSETRVIDADFSKIKRDESRDEVLRQFDIIEVASKGSGKRKYPPMVAADENAKRADSELPLRVID